MDSPELPEETKQQIILLAERLGPTQILEGLEDLIVREKYLLMSDRLEPEDREIITHGLAILVAVSAGYSQAIQESMSAKPE
jgi:hypothetical protein